MVVAPAVRQFVLTVHLTSSLGWLGAVISVVAWVTLGRALAQDGPSATITSGILGAWTGFVGTITTALTKIGNTITNP